MFKILFIFLSLMLGFILLFPYQNVFARVSPDDIYKAKRAEFDSQLLKIEDPVKKEAIIKSDKLLVETNLKVCKRFDQDILKMAAILEQLKEREGVTETVVAFGRGDTQLDTAAYYLTYAAEALAYQKIQDYTPKIGANNSQALRNSSSNLKANLTTVQNKILRAKSELKKASDEYQN